MARYRKRPVVIDAWPWPEYPPGAPVHPQSEWPGDPQTVETLEGPMTRKPGDWLIRGVRGEFYPCKPDIFNLTYEEATDGKG